MNDFGAPEDVLPAPSEDGLVSQSDAAVSANDAACINLFRHHSNPLVYHQVNHYQVLECAGMRPASTRYHVGDGFFFHLQRASGGRMYLRCVGYYTTPRCNVRAVMNDDRSHFAVVPGQAHCHGPDMHFERVMRLRDALLEACRVRRNVRVELIYHDVCRR